MQICDNCGGELKKPGHKFCSNCGSRISDSKIIKKQTREKEEVEGFVPPLKNVEKEERRKKNPLFAFFGVLASLGSFKLQFGKKNSDSVKVGSGNQTPTNKPKEKNNEKTPKGKTVRGKAGTKMFAKKKVPKM